MIRALRENLATKAIRTEQRTASPAITNSQSADNPAIPKIKAAGANVDRRIRFPRICTLASFSSSPLVRPRLLPLSGQIVVTARLLTEFWPEHRLSAAWRSS